MPTPYPNDLITDLAGTDSNSYCDLDFANSYFENHFNTAKSVTWSAYTDGQKIQALIQACYTIEQIRFTSSVSYGNYQYSPGENYGYYNGFYGGYYGGYYGNRQYHGGDVVKSTQAQSLQFPRSSDMLQDGTYYIPDKVLFAQCEQAIYLAVFDETAIANMMQGIAMDSIEVDKIKLTQEYRTGFKPSTLAPMALDYLKPYMISGKRIARA